MCAQFVIRTKLKDLARIYSAKIARHFEWKTHVFPTYLTPVVVAGPEGREIRPMHFGLYRYFQKANPHNVKKEWKRSVFHNARIETIHEKPSFKKAFLSRRCLVPIESFFEFTGPKGSKIRLEFEASGSRLLTAAGIWGETRGLEGEMEESFSIITQPPPKFILENGHDRCPRFLKEEAFDEWLSPEEHSPNEMLSVLESVDKIDFSLKAKAANWRELTPIQ